MNMQNWMDISRVAKYLKFDEKSIQKMVDKKLIPYSLIGGYPRFNQQRIDEWLLNKEYLVGPAETDKDMLDGVEYNRNIVNKIADLSDLELDINLKYFNLKKDKVKAQIHPPNPKFYKEPDGIELVIPEYDEGLPNCKNLKNKFPNFITVDFCDIGESLDVVNKLNLERK